MPEDTLSIKSTLEWFSDYCRIQNCMKIFKRQERKYFHGNVFRNEIELMKTDKNYKFKSFILHLILIRYLNTRVSKTVCSLISTMLRQNKVTKS
jgi:hypothetical protein